MMNIPTLFKACMDIKASGDNLFVWILVIYVVFQVAASTLIAIFMNYERVKWMLLTLSTFLFLGNVLFTHGVAIGDSVFLLFVGRAMCGVAGSVLIVGYSQITLCCNLLRREWVIMRFRFISALGMLIGPFVGLLMSTQSFTILGGWHIGDTNGGSFVMSCAAMLFMVLFTVYLLYNYFIKSKQRRKQRESHSDIAHIHRRTQQNYTVNMFVDDDGGSDGNENEREKREGREREKRICIHRWSRLWNGGDIPINIMELFCTRTTAKLIEK